MPVYPVKSASIDAALMRDLGVNALALLTTLPGPVSWRRTAPIDVMHIAVAGLPMPANTVSWQTLQELRADNESKSKLKRLRAWITDVATREQSLKQIVEALKDLFSDYHGYLQGRSVTVRFFSIGTIVVVSRMLAEGFGKGEKIKSNLARIRHSREPLMESEVGDVGAWVMHYEPSHMSNPLSEADAERLSNARVSVADEHNLIQYYELGKFLRLPSFDQVQSGQTRNRRLKINHWADKAYRTYSPEVKNKITIEENRKRFKKAFEEHEHSSTELLGDYPRKLKKWALYVFSDYAEQLAEVAFAMFRLDELNACALLLPSGIPAVILNASLLTSVPFIVSAFMGLYDKLFARDKREPKSQAPEIGFVIDMARAFASRNYEEVTKLQRSFASIGRANLYVDINFNWSLFVALHECAHIILNHLSSSAAANTEVSGIKLLVRSQQLEYAADEFAIRHWLFVDPEPDADHAFKIAATCTCVFAFFQLISNISSERIDSHPQATYRWTAVRPHLLSINGAEPLVKKCEEMISMISTVQQFT